MATRTATQDGTWNDTATWGGNPAPGNGDLAVIGTGFDVTVTASVTVGDSPAASSGTYAIDLDGGTLTINTGVTLTVRGDFRQHSAAVTLNGTATVEFDPSAAASPATAAYVWYCGTAVFDSSTIVLAGTDVANRCEIRTKAGAAAGAYARITDGDNLARFAQSWQYATLTRLGGSGTDAVHTASPLTTVTDCRFEACGRVQFLAAFGYGAGTSTFARNTFAGSLGANNLRLVHGFDTEVIEDCVFDGATQFDTYIPSNCLFWKETVVVTGTWTGNLVACTNNFGTSMATGSSLDGNYLLCYNGGSLVSNPHWYLPNAGPFSLVNNIIDGGDANGDGDVMLHCDYAGTYTVSGNLGVCGHRGIAASPGTLVTIFGVAGTLIVCEHNTWYCGVQSVLAGEGGTPAGVIDSYKSNLAFSDPTYAAYSPTAELGPGHIRDTAYVGVPASGPDLGDGGDCTHNTAWRCYTGGVEGGAYNAPMSGAAPGANDQNADPDFVDGTRNLCEWGRSLGLTGTNAQIAADTVTAMSKLNDSDFDTRFTLSALMTWVRAGYAPTNTALKDAGHDGVTIGAVEGVFGGAAPLPLVGGGLINRGLVNGGLAV